MSRLTVSPLAQYDPSGGHVKITAPYGDGRNHKGVDWGTTDGIEVGTTLYAPVDGYVESTGYDGPYTPGHHTAGNWLWFNGRDGTRWKMFHLNKVTIGIGISVKAGTPIAEVGNSGTQAAHLHLEEHVGSWNNPIDFTNDAYEVISAGRWPGSTGDWFAMVSEEDLRRIVTDEINKAMSANYVGARAVQAEGDSNVYEIVVRGDGHLARRLIRDYPQQDMLQFVDHLAGDGNDVRVIKNQLQKEAFNLLPLV